MIFLVPLRIDGNTKVLLGVIADWINATAGMHMRTFCAFVFVSSAIIAGGISSPVTNFVLAGLSVTQLIFMAETGVLTTA